MPFREEISKFLTSVRNGVAATVVAAAALAPVQALAGPFDGFVGLWVGSGTMTYASGTREKLRCRVQYVQNDESNLQQAMKCASPGAAFQINTYVLYEDGAIRGRWEEITRNIGGSVSGSVSGSNINGTLSVLDVKVQYSVKTTGNRQKVKIISPDQEIRRIDIEVRRSTRG